MEKTSDRNSRFGNTLAKVAKDVIASGAAKFVIAILGLISAFAMAWWSGDERPAWMNELVQTIAMSGSMNENSSWQWGNIALKPIDGASNKMKFSGHPDGDVFIEFTDAAMRLNQDEPREREFSIYCGTHHVKTGTGSMAFRRSFQVVTTFDIDGNSLLEIWLRGDLMTKDAKGNVARH